MRAIVSILCIIASIILGVYGWLHLTVATFGVGIICLACLFGIWARIAQAGFFDERSRALLVEAVKSINHKFS